MLFMEVMTWAKYAKKNGHSSHYAKEAYGFEYFGDYHKDINDSRPIHEIVKAWVEDKARTFEKDVSIAIYESKKKDWQSSYDLKIYVK